MNAPKMLVLNTYDNIGSKIIMPTQEYGETFRVRIVKIIDDHEIKLAQDPGHTQFILSVDDYKYKEIMPYNDIIKHIKNQEDQDIVWKFKRIFFIRDHHLMTNIPTKKDIVIML